MSIHQEAEKSIPEEETTVSGELGQVARKRKNVFCTSHTQMAAEDGANRSLQLT
jgi:hypothetical protein